MNKVKLKDCIAPSFYKVHKLIRKKAYQEFWFAGGRASTKSAFAAIELILDILSDPNSNAICFRKVADTLRSSVYANILWAIEKLGVQDEFVCTVSPMEIRHISGQQIMFKGLDKAGKLKSIRPNKGTFKIAWFEELEEFNGMEEIRNVLQSVIRGDDDAIALFTYNPPQDPNSWVNTENHLDEETFKLTSSVPYRYISQTTYLTVPPEWLGERFFKMANALKEKDLQAYEHEYLGHAVGNVKRLVFSGKFKVMDFETPPVSELYQQRFFIGMDFGFADDPTAVVRCFIKDNKLYIDYEAGGKHIENENIAPTIIRDIPDARNWTIYADSSRPETISYVRRNGGLDVKPCKKWTGNREDSIAYVKSFDDIIVHSRCKNVIYEMSRYSYKVDRNTQEILPKLEEKNDHYLDGLFYSLCMYIMQKVSILDVI